ncbi:MAG: DUF2797 domain-containing protein [Candidatus Odinarchaeota archaeon]
MPKHSYYLKIAWKKEILSPVVRIYDPISAKILESPITRQWNIATGNVRHCTGYKDLEGLFTPCPDESATKPGKSSSTCSSCFSRDPWRYRAISRGYPVKTGSMNGRTVMDDENTSVYLTLIGNNLKVGVSTEPVRRWLDQGSDYAILLWHGDGLAARKIENRVEAYFSIITKTITFNQKFQALREIHSEQEAQKKLLSFKKEVYDQLELPPSEDFDSSFFNLLQYQGPLVRSLTSFSPFLQDIKEQTVIRGDLAVIKGPLLVLKENQTFYAYNLHQLDGWEVEDPAAITKRVQRQKSLLDFT